jgi:hypothetical protein
MILKYVGYSISGVLFIIFIAFFGMSMYVGYKYMDKLLPTQKSLTMSMKYSFLGVLSLGLSLFVLLTVQNGYSWDNVFGLLFIVILVSVLIVLNYFVLLKTTSFLKRRNFSLESLWNINPTMNRGNKSHINQNTGKSTDKENEP